MHRFLCFFLLLFVCSLNAPAVSAAEDGEEGYYKVTTNEAAVYRRPDPSSGILCSPYRYGEILEGVIVENDRWISIPFGSDRRGYVLRRGVAPLTEDERTAYLAEQAAAEAGSEVVAAEGEEGFGETAVAEEHVYPFFNGVKAGRNAIWFIVAALVLLTLSIFRRTRKDPDGKDPEAWSTCSALMFVTAALELWYFCSLGFAESAWFLSDPKADFWFCLLLFFGVSALQGFLSLVYLSFASGRGDIESSGFSVGWIVFGVILAAALYGVAALMDFYVVSEAVTCVLCVTVGLIPHFIKVARHVPFRVAVTYFLMAIGTLILLAASTVILAALIICGLIMVLAVIMAVQGGWHAVTHMEETSHEAMRSELWAAEQAFARNQINAAELDRVRNRIEPFLKPKK